MVRDLVGEAFNRLDPLAQEIMQALAVYGAPVPRSRWTTSCSRIASASTAQRRWAASSTCSLSGARQGAITCIRWTGITRSAGVEGQPDDREAEPPPITRYALRHRAAEYFRESRKPRESWKTLEDLAPQLAEFDLRLAGETSPRQRLC